MDPQSTPDTDPDEALEDEGRWFRLPSICGLPVMFLADSSGPVAPSVGSWSDGDVEWHGTDDGDDDEAADDDEGEDDDEEAEQWAIPWSDSCPAVEMFYDSITIRVVGMDPPPQPAGDLRRLLNLLIDAHRDWVALGLSGNSEYDIIDYFTDRQEPSGREQFALSPSTLTIDGIETACEALARGDITCKWLVTGDAAIAVAGAHDSLHAAEFTIITAEDERWRAD